MTTVAPARFSKKRLTALRPQRGFEAAGADRSGRPPARG